MMPKSTGVVIFLLLFGLLFTGIGIGSQYSVMNKTELTQGTIVEINKQRNTEESENSPRGYLFTPVVEYTVESKTLTVASKFYTYPFNFEVGDSVRVWYNPARPENMAVEGHDKRGGLNPLGVIFLYFGSCFTIMSILWKFSEKRPAAAKKALIYVLCLYWASFLIISRVIFFSITIFVILLRRDIKRRKNLIENGEKFMRI